MPNPKRQHYIPRFYLNNFSNDGKIWLFDRYKKEYRYQSIKDTAVIKDYYTLKNESKKDYKIEKLLGDVENESKKIIDKFLNKKELTEYDKITFSIFLALIFTRTPDFEKTINEFTDKAVKKIHNFVFNDIDKTRIQLKYLEEKTGKKYDLSAEEFYDFIKEEKYEIKYDRINMIFMMIHQATGLFPHFFNKDWVIINSDNAKLITSDNPLVLLPTEGHFKNPHYGYGINTPGVKKILTLNHNNVLILADAGNKFDYGTTGDFDLNKINYFIATESQRYIFGKEKEVLEKIVFETKIDQWKNKGKINVF